MSYPFHLFLASNWMSRRVGRAWAFALGLTAAVWPAMGAEAPRNRDCRLMITWDQQSMWCLQLGYANRGQEPVAETVKSRLDAVIDEHARAQVDRIVHCVFALPGGTVPAAMESFYRQPWTGKFTEDDTGIVVMESGGYDVIQVMLDRAHQNGMEFLAGLRMNDRHGDPWATPFGQQHSAWRLREGDLRGFDYRQAGVRKTMLDVAHEILERYDVDGIELDWMRHCHMFNPSEAQQSAEVLTRYVADMRQVLRVAAERRGRERLLLGVRVPQTLQECQVLGFDVRAWIQDGAVDYVCPSDFFYLDYNIRVEDFVACARGTGCKVYPSVHAKIAQEHFHDVPTAENYRAAAQNFLEYGADGISVYNYHYHWRADMGSEDAWPGVMANLTGLRDLSTVARGDRHYIYYPLWPPNTCPTGAQFDKFNTIILNRDALKGSLSFRMTEDLANPALSGSLAFKVLGLPDDHQVSVVLNGHPVPRDQIQRTRMPDGRPASQGRPLPPYDLLQFAIDPSWTRWGDNRLELQCVGFDAEEHPAILAQEFEVIVRVQ